MHSKKSHVAYAKLVSIIVPIYNRENYLSRCIESILRQTYKNWELILVDDGSTDRSYDICLDYAQKNKDIKVIHKENSGAAGARNCGLASAQGQFVVFVDSDDTIEENHISNMINAYEQSGDLVLCGYNMVYGNVIRPVSPGNHIIEKKDFITFLNQWLLDPVIGSPCNKLIEVAKIKKYEIRYLETLNYAEDYLFSTELLNYCDRVIAINDCSYNYSKETPASLTKINSIDLKKWWQMQKEVFNRLQAISFLKNTTFPQKILCILMLNNCIEQFNKTGKINDWFIQEIDQDPDCKQSLVNIKKINVSWKMDHFYSVLRVRLLHHKKAVRYLSDRILRLFIWLKRVGNKV